MTIINTGKLAHATLDAQDQSLASVNINGLGQTGAMEAHVRDTNTAQSSIADFNFFIAGGAIIIVGDALQTRADTGVFTAVGLNVRVQGVSQTIPVNPGPNTQLDLSINGNTIAQLILNEQYTKDGRFHMVALHLELLGGVLGSLGNGNVKLAHSIIAT